MELCTVHMTILPLISVSCQLTFMDVGHILFFYNSIIKSLNYEIIILFDYLLIQSYDYLII